MDYIEDNQVLQPFQMKILPIRKLFLLNFEKHPDAMYLGLELQWLDSKEEGRGYRIIAYRSDGYVDVYDEETIKKDPEDNFEVCGKGLKHYRQTSLGNPSFQYTEEGIAISFSFIDYKGRTITAKVQEHSKKKSRWIDLIAPVGVNAKQPVYLPVFQMFQFDLIRKKKTEAILTIDGAAIEPDAFPIPIPKDGQMRYFMRYGYDCELIDFAHAGKDKIALVSCEDDRSNVDGLITSYEKTKHGYAIKSITLEKAAHPYELIFQEPFPDLIRMEDGTVTGEFKIQMKDTMGYIAGEYQVKKECSIVHIMLEPTKGWNVKRDMFLTKMLFQKKSVFCSWAKTYRYLHHIDLNKGTSECKWIRIEKEK